MRLLGVLMLSCVAGCARESEPATTPAWYVPAAGWREAPASNVERGQATYYGNSLAGNRTASGDRYDPRELTAAHKHLPFGTIVRVTREDDGKSVIVRINDRGPFGNESRIIDVSYAAAEALDMIRAGVVPVRVEILEPARR
jgi:rare lipoprotein A